MAIKYHNGKKYNTDTAMCIGAKPLIQESCFVEKLFRKKSGEYFLVCEGTKNSVFSDKLIIKPLVYDEAEKWAKNNLPNDIYKKNFLSVDATKISVQLDKITAEKFELYKRINNLGTTEAVKKIFNELAF